MPPANLASLQSAFGRALPGVTRELRGRRLPYAVLLGLLVLIGYLAARLTWQFAAPAPAAAPTGAGAPVAAPAGHRTEGPAARIAAAHLFGVSAKTPQLAAENAPETSLDLNLLGVAAGTSGAPSRAIIASGSSGEQNTYQVGATLPGGAVVRQILPDRVVIAHNGRLESLRLPVAGTSLIAAHMNFGTPGAAQTQVQRPHTHKGPAGSPSPSQLRRRIAEQPESLAQFMRLRPYARKGHLRGYRVFPGQSPELFRRAGLKPGDIVTSVNGISLDNPKAGMRAISQLRNAKGPVQVVVLRQGKPVHLTINIPGG